MNAHTTELRVLREARAIVERLDEPQGPTPCAGRRRRLIDPVVATTWGLVVLGLTAFWVTVFALACGWRPA
jgi:hypothetical protein